MKNIHTNNHKGFGLIGIVIIIAIAALVGGGGYYATHKGKSSAHVSVNGNATTTAPEKKSLRELMAIGTDITCTFTRQDDKSKVTGTVFVSGKQMRGDFVMTAGSVNNMDSHMIRTGDTMYLWSSAQPGKGFKMNITEDAKAGAQGQGNAAQAQAVNIDDKVDYQCSKWTPDATKFTAPTDVSFTDFSAMLKGRINIPNPLAQ